MDILPISSILHYTLQSLTKASDIVRASLVISKKDELAKALLRLESSVRNLRATMNQYNSSVSEIINNLRIQLRYALKGIKQHVFDISPRLSIASILHPLSILILLAFPIAFLVSLRSYPRRRYIIGSLFITAGIV